MKRLCISVIISIVFIILFIIPSYAENYTPYASVTSSTSNISMLIDTMLNQDDFNPFKDWVAIRTGQYDYSVFYNIDSGDCNRIRYYGVSSGYQTEYYLSFTTESNFSYYRGNYTIVGNTEDSLASQSYQNYFFRFILIISVPAILVVFLFFVFRIRKAKRSLSI